MITFNKNTAMATPIPNPNDFDVNKIIEVFIAVVGALVASLAWMRSHFKDKASSRDAAIQAKKVESEEFIEKVAIACVKATLDSTMGDVKADIAALFKYREDDRKHYDDRFDKVMAAIKK
jgi:hypothetical protein